MKNKSKSHNDLYTGILDRKGQPIYKNSTIAIYDNYREINRENNPYIGKIVWKDGNYSFKSKGVLSYNIYAWRKKLEVVNSDGPILFHELTIQEELDIYRFKEVPIIIKPEQVYKCINEAFIAGYKKAIERNYE